MYQAIPTKVLKKYRIFDTVSQNDFLEAQGCSQRALNLRALWLHPWPPQKSFWETVSKILYFFYTFVGNARYMLTFCWKCQHVSSISHKSIKKYRICGTVSKNDLLGDPRCSQRALNLRAFWLHPWAPKKSFWETVSKILYLFILLWEMLDTCWHFAGNVDMYLAIHTKV